MEKFVDANVVSYISSPRGGNTNSLCVGHFKREKEGHFRPKRSRRMRAEVTERGGTGSTKEKSGKEG